MAQSWKDSPSWQGRLSPRTLRQCHLESTCRKQRELNSHFSFLFGKGLQPRVWRFQHSKRAFPFQLTGSINIHKTCPVVCFLEDSRSYPIDRDDEVSRRRFSGCSNSADERKARCFQLWDEKHRKAFAYLCSHCQSGRSQ